MKDFFAEHWMALLLFMVLAALSISELFTKYLDHELAKEYIKAGLVQDTDGRWVKP